MLIDRPRPSERKELVAFTRATGFFDSEDLQTVEEMLDDYFNNPESDEYIWVVYRDAPGAPPLGYACYGPASMAADVYDLYWIVVDPKVQGKRIGSALLEYVEGDMRARNARQLYIETSDTEQYTPTRAFYEKRGYETVAILRDYYDVDDGKVIFCKVFRGR